MKTYLIVSFVPLPDVVPGQPTTVVASSRWDGLASAGKVTILNVFDDAPLPSVDVVSAALPVDDVDAWFDSWVDELDDGMPVDGTIREVLDWVEASESALERRTRAFDALEYEYTGKNRTTLVNALAAIVGDTDDFR